MSHNETTIHPQASQINMTHQVGHNKYTIWRADIQEKSENHKNWFL